MLGLILILGLSYYIYTKQSKKRATILLIAGLSFLISISCLINKDKNVSYEMVSMKETTHIVTEIKENKNGSETLISDEGTKIKLDKSKFFLDNEDYWNSDESKLAKVTEINQYYEIKNKLISLFFIAPKEKIVDLYKISYNSNK